MTSPDTAADTIDQLPSVVWLAADASGMTGWRVFIAESRSLVTGFIRGYLWDENGRPDRWIDYAASPDALIAPIDDPNFIWPPGLTVPDGFAPLFPPERVQDAES